MKWMLPGGKPKSHRGGLVGIYDTPSSISIFYRAPENLEGPVIKNWAIEFASTLIEKQAFLTKFTLENQLQWVPCVYVLAPGDYSLNLVEAPNVAKEEIPSAMNWILKDLINFPINEAVIDTFELPFARAKDNIKMLYAAVIRKSLMEKIQALIEPSNLDLQAIDIPELIFKDLLNNDKEPPKGCVFLQLWATGGKMIIYKGKELCISRSFEIKFDDLKSDSRSLENLALEVQRSFDYMNSVFRQNIPNLIILAPTLLDTNILQTSLKTTLGSEVKLLHLTDIFKVEQPLSEAKEVDCFLAAGATLRDEVEPK